MIWTEAKFGEFCEVQPKVTLNKKQRYSFVPMEDVRPSINYLRSSKVKEFSGNGARFAEDDTIFARITPCLENGKINFIKRLDTGGVGFGSTEFFIFRARPGISNPRYLFYLSCSAKIVEPAIKSMVGSSGRQRAQKEVVEAIHIKVARH